MQIGQTLDDLETAARPKPEAKVVRAKFGQPTTSADRAARIAATPQVPAAEMDRARDAVVTDLTQRRAPQPTEETSRERFRRALELERAMAAGGGITPEQQRWLSVYQTSPEYGGERQVWESFGDSVFG
jgi:putative transposase